jgi:hypothetical protein
LLLLLLPLAPPDIQRFGKEKVLLRRTRSDLS